jgi:predicted metal-dependent peptidase
MVDILEELKPTKIFFGQCDTRLHDVVELTPDDLPLPALTVKGRGGTDMEEAFEWACQNEDEIEAFILQTDGYVPALDRRCTRRYR